MTAADKLEALADADFTRLNDIMPEALPVLVKVVRAAQDMDEENIAVSTPALNRMVNALHDLEAVLQEVPNDE